MEVMKQIERVMNQVEKIDYKSVYIEIATQNDKFIIDKTKPKNRIGFEVKGRPYKTQMCQRHRSQDSTKDNC